MGQILLQAEIFLVWSVHFAASGGNPLPDITNEKFIDDCVRMHNENRSSVSPPASDMLYMTWDEGLAITARAWARFCDFQHNIHLRDTKRVHPVFSSVGENIWAGSPPTIFTVLRAMNSWVDNEVKDYNYESNGCTNVCGHYTQVAWARTYKVGCAVQICPNGVAKTSFAAKEGAMFVCNYAEAGNVNGQLPYQRGPACSACQGVTDQCQNKLCRNPERDELKRYNWTPDWDPALSTCGPSCLAVLAIRPLALLITFIATYGLHRLYPNMFCYE